VVLQTTNGYTRSPIALEAAFDLILRHLHRNGIKWPVEKRITVSALLADRATAALLLPGRFLPTPTGEILDLIDCVELSQTVQSDATVADPVKIDENPPVLDDIALEEVDSVSVVGVDGGSEADPSLDDPAEQSQIPSPDTAGASPLSIPVSVVVDKCLESLPPSTKKDRKRAAQQARRRCR
jgi:hypothetical protein